MTQHITNTHTDPLLSDIEAFLSRTGMGPTYFGKLAVGNAELVGRLRQGRDVTRRTEMRVRDFMAKHLEKAS